MSCCKPTLKAFNSSVPCGVCIREPVVTRLIAFSCMPTASAISFRIIGLILEYHILRNRADVLQFRNLLVSLYHFFSQSP